jgi:hypothetical protein
VPEVRNGVFSAGGRLPDIRNGVAPAGGRLPDIRNGVPRVGGRLPDIRNGVPRVGGRLPEVRNGVPRVGARLPEVRNGVSHENDDRRSIPFTFRAPDRHVLLMRQSKSRAARLARNTGVMAGIDKRITGSVTIDGVTYTPASLKAVFSDESTAITTVEALQRSGWTRCS